MRDKTGKIPPPGPATGAEKAKPFMLVKYFTFTSLIVIFFGAVTISVLNTHWARSMLLKKSEDYGRLLIENLNHQVFLQFIIPAALKYGKIQLRQPEQFERLDKVVRSTLHTFSVRDVHFYDVNGVVTYGFNTDNLGEKRVMGSEFEKAVKGTVNSRLHQSGSFLEILLGLPKENRLITFAPLRSEQPLSLMAGPVLGVVEIEQDLTSDYESIFQFQILVITTSAAVMTVLFIVLRLVVKRGENIIHQRAQERLRLKEQLARAERLSALGGMVAAVSHEIRNPLGIIKSSAEHLRKKMGENGGSAPIAGIIVEEATRLNGIITDFLNYARPKTPDMHPCRVEEVLEKNLSFISRELEEKNVAVAMEAAPDLPPVLADADMLYQAFLNILLNAVQAMPRGGNLLVEVIGDDEWVTAAFEDSGDGIDEEVLEKIWDPFFTTKDTGTGLGLGIVRNVAEAHGGSVAIENTETNGARVSVRLPAARRPV